ncbi:MAG TPA: cupredoxin family copper-binding protein [Gammaproteobacteria bacterium]|nr:cupredoxin family copper-binding protein [Gammaproteobacteria bacterium]
MYKMNLYSLVLFLGVAAAMITGVVRAGEPPVAAASQEVAIFNYKFAPDALTIPAGTTVTWVNKDEVPHTVMSTDKRFQGSGALDTGDKYSYTFTTPGSYEYFCTLHPFMKGKIVVTAPAQPAAAKLD